MLRLAAATGRREVPWADTVVYELHVRGFTAAHPAVPEELRGTYAGLAHPAVVEHLVGLGVTAVELLPVHQFVSEPSCCAAAWSTTGATTRSASSHRTPPTRPPAPAASRWASSRDDGPGAARGRHRGACSTSSTTTPPKWRHGPTLRRRGLDNAAYYRLLARGRYVDVTGCGNTLDLRQPRALALVIDSLRYWVAGDARRRFPLRPGPGPGPGQHDAFDSPGPSWPSSSRTRCCPRSSSSPSRGTSGRAATSSGGFPAPWAEWNDRFRDTVRESWLGGHGAASGSGVRDLGLPRCPARRTCSRRRSRPAGLGQLRHRPRRLHPARPGVLRAQAQRGQRRGQPRRHATTTAAGTAASRDRPTTRTCWRCAAG